MSVKRLLAATLLAGGVMPVAARAWVERDRLKTIKRQMYGRASLDLLAA